MSVYSALLPLLQIIGLTELQYEFSHELLVGATINIKSGFPFARFIFIRGEVGVATQGCNKSFIDHVKAYVLSL